MIVDKYGSAAVTPLVTSGTVAGHGAEPHAPSCQEQDAINLPLREWEINQARTALCS